MCRSKPGKLLRERNVRLKVVLVEGRGIG